MDAEHRIERAADGGVLLLLPPAERELLLQLRAELVTLLATEPDDPSLKRLFPPAYDDKRAAAEYRRLMHDELLAGHHTALDVLETTADRERLSAEEAEAWLRALNDLRLVLGTRLDVREDTFAEGLDLSDPRAPELAVYGYLSWLQEELVAALSR
jgi:Domain of unknown function (DUF2017)